MNMFKGITFKEAINCFLYGTRTKEEYRLNKERANRENHAVLLLFFIVLIILILLEKFVFAPQCDWIDRNISTYAFCIIASAVVWVLNVILGKKIPFITTCSAYFAIIIAFASTIMIATRNDYSMVTIYLAALAFFSVIYIVSPLGLMILHICGDIACAYVCSFYHPAEAQKINNSNTTLISIFGVLVGLTVIMYRQAKITNDRRLEDLIYRDSMTGLNNRKSFEEALAAAPRDKTVTICALDINSLKRANDTIGHDAGDELITSAAAIIRETFGGFGESYRIGGDEFAVVMSGSVDVDALKKELERRMREWHGQLNDSLSISYGFGSTADYQDCTMHSLLSLADKNMYDSKKSYYAQNENERRIR